jgi:beta-glucanase (GH16 family)
MKRPIAARVAARRALGLAGWAAACIAAEGGGGQPPPPIPADYRLTWAEEFDGARLDPARWDAETGPRRDAHNVADAVSVSNGWMTIATYTDGGRHCTGFVSTRGKYEVRFGYVEARIRFRSVPGMWSAFWLHSPTIGRPLDNPAAAGTEIDVVEHRRADREGRDISDTYVMTLHWNGYAKGVQRSEGGQSLPPGGRSPLQGEWHTYGLLWTPDRYRFYLDGVEQWTTTNAVSHRGEFILLTSEVEDRGWAGDVPGDGYGSRAAGIARMDVDHVRVYQPAEATR